MTPRPEDDEFLTLWEREARGYNEPPETPHEAMWDAIQLARRERRSDRVRRIRWMRWSTAAAAVLVLGIAVGRLTAPAEDSSPSVSVDTSPGVLGRDRAGVAFRMVAEKHLSQTESLLSWLGAEETSELDEETSAFARNLLTTTRLLIDSPASDTPVLKQLFLDLELVLAQIVQVTRGEMDESELELIREGMHDQAVLMRLRTALPVGSPRAGV